PLRPTLFPYTTLFRSQSVEHHSLLENINWLSPALEVAESIQRKTAKIGFDWENKQELWDKFSEEKQEFIEALENGLEHEAEVEFGDILFRSEEHTSELQSRFDLVCRLLLA